MDSIFKIPEALKEPFRRTLYLAPEKLRANDRFQQLTLLHLKVGGERLACHNTEIFKLTLEEESIFYRGFRQEGDGNQADGEDRHAKVEESTDEDERVSSDDEENTADEDEDAFDDDSSGSKNATGSTELKAGTPDDDFYPYMEYWADGSAF